MYNTYIAFKRESFSLFYGILDLFDEYIKYA